MSLIYSGLKPILRIETATKSSMTRKDFIRIVRLIEDL